MKVRGEINSAGIKTSGPRKGRKAATSETNITYSVKNIYNLTYIFIFRLQHESFVHLEPAAPPHNILILSPFRTVDTLVKLSFRSITGPVYTCHFKTCVWDPDQCSLLKKNSSIFFFF